ncbi:hypothetical protein [Microbacterium sp. KR10-403]|uniref:hypothetical protein n=1 Tax=Microbacterium sp. KR10-403 TaxID=3158581 RepID=UPI0032E45FC5
MITGLKAAAQLQATIAAVAALVDRMPVQEPTADAPDPHPFHTPRELRMWLAHLRLLESVPFSHLVADAELLPPESIRFFHLDRAWTDALVEGALSVGTVTTGDRATLAALYPVVREEIDESERLVRLPGWTAGQEAPSGPAGPVTGFVLRSRMVSGWPAMSVRGYARDNLALSPKQDDDLDVDAGGDAAMGKLQILRMERLAPAVLLVLFDGVPAVVHLEEPRAGVQFGFHQVGDTNRMEVHTRSIEDGTRAVSATDTVPVPYRSGVPGVVHVHELAQRLVEKPHRVTEQNPTGRMDAAVFAVELLQFPFRSVYGDQTLTPSGGGIDIGDLFLPTVTFDFLADRFEHGPAAYTFPREVNP